MKRQLFTFFLMLFICFGTYAEEIQVSPDTYKDIYDNANDGDVLLMESGVYITRLYLPYEGKTITLKAMDGATPILKWEWRSNSDNNSGGIIFDGMTIDLKGDDGNNASYFFNITSKNIKEIVFRNCIIQNIGRCLIRSLKTDETNTINKIEINNSIIRECGTGRYNLIYTQLGVKEFTVKNSTLYNYNDGESFFCPYAANPNNVLNFTFENNTVYNWSGATAGRAFAKIMDFYNANSTYTFRNNIIAEHTGSNLPSMVDITAGTVIAEKNLIVNYGGYIGGSQTISDLTLGDLGLTEIGFNNPSDGDFSILSTSPIATGGVGGKPLGAPRWINTSSSINTAQHINKEIKSIIYYNLQGHITSKIKNEVLITKTLYIDGSVSVEKTIGK